MREVRVLCGLAAIAAAVGCSKNSDQNDREAKSPSGTTQEGANPQTATEEPAAPPADTSGMAQPGEPAQNEPPSTTDQQQQQQQQAQQAQQAGAQDLVMGTFACLLGPVMNHGAGRGGGPQGTGSTQDDYGTNQAQDPSGKYQGTPGSTSGTAPGSTGATGGTAPGSTSGTGNRGGGPTSTGPDSDRCTSVAKEANVQPTAVYKAEPAAIDSVRRVIDSRLSGEGVSSDVSNNTLAFFDKGVAAAKEARTAEEAFSRTSAAKAGAPHTSSKPTTTPKSGTTPTPTTSSAEMMQNLPAIRAHRDLSSLYQFGRNLGMTATGTEAQALAWVIASERFVKVADVPTSFKSAAAEPLFGAILNVEPPPAPAGRAAPSWNEYLSSAARSVGATSTQGRGVGGGPGAANNEKANLAEIAKASAERMQVLGQQLPASSELRADVDQTSAELKERFPAPTATKPPSKPAPKNPPKSTPAK